MKRSGTVMLALICVVISARLVLGQQDPEGLPQLHIYPTKIALDYDLANYDGPQLYRYGVTSKQSEALAKVGGNGDVEMTTPDGKITTYPAQASRTGARNDYEIYCDPMPNKHILAGTYKLVFIYAGQRSSPDGC